MLRALSAWGKALPAPENRSKALIGRMSRWVSMAIPLSKSRVEYIIRDIR